MVLAEHGTTKQKIVATARTTDTIFFHVFPPKKVLWRPETFPSCGMVSDALYAIAFVLQAKSGLCGRFIMNC